MSLWYEDKLLELKESKNIAYDDVLYVIPFHMVSRNNTFNDLKKVSVVSIETKGHNTRGCEVTGKVVTYDKNALPVEQFYSGNAIYRYKPGGGVITQDGIKWPLQSLEKNCHILTDRPLVQLWCRFYASNGLFVEVPVAKGIYFNRAEDAINYGKKHYFVNCLLHIDRLECVLDGYRVIFQEYCIVKDEKVYMGKKSKEELWMHMLANEKPVIQDPYGMAYSKVFYLKCDSLIARKCTGEFLSSVEYPVPELLI